MVCLLTPNRYASYTVPVRQYRILQSDLRSGQSLRNVHRTFLRSLPLQCIPRGKPPCDLLMLRAQLVPLSNGNPAHKGFSPSGKKNHPRTIGIFNKICKFDIFTDLRWWVHCSCRAHTRGIKNCRGSRLFKGCSPLQLMCNLIGNRPQSATFHTANVRAF